MSRPLDPIPPTRNVSIDCLRTALTLMVVAHHSSLAYTSFAHFDSSNYLASTAPVVDNSRWLVLDYAQNFNDIFFMSLMFFVSGLFVWPSLQRHGVKGFLRERALRLGLPFVFFVSTLMPLAYYGSWQLTGNDSGYLDYWINRYFFAHGWPPGPLWFIWMLLLFDCIVALLGIRFLKEWNSLKAMHDFAKNHPLPIFMSMFILGVFLHLPLLAEFNNIWVPLGSTPFYFQLSRIGLYFAWFVFGTFIGTAQIENGLLAEEGLLAKNWRWWTIFTIIAFGLLYAIPYLLNANNLLSSNGRGIVWIYLWVLSCTASCFGFLALFRGNAQTRRMWMDSLSRSAYIIYIVHYVFVVWIQRALMEQPLHAGIKFVTVFALSVLLSWITAQVLLRIPGAARVL